MTQPDTTPDARFKTFFCSLSENWWAFILRGVLALAIAVLAFIVPAQSLMALTLVFGAFSFADGIFGVIAAVRHMREGEKWGWLLFSGILGILTGIVVVISPFIATLVLAIFLWSSIAFWSTFSGAFEIAAAVRLRKEIEGEVWLGLSGLISIFIGAVIVWMLFTRPLESFLALGWLLGIYAAILGVFMIMLGLRLRKSASGTTSVSEPASADNIADKPGI